MDLTDIRIKLCEDQGNRLKAFCALTFDNTFVIRDVKLIEGNDGLFLAMPSRKLCDHCPACGEKNHLRARFCNGCGRRLDETRSHRIEFDIATTNTAACCTPRALSCVAQRRAIGRSPFRGHWRTGNRWRTTGSLRRPNRSASAR